MGAITRLWKKKNNDVRICECLSVHSLTMVFLIQSFIYDMVICDIRYMDF